LTKKKSRTTPSFPIASAGQHGFLLVCTHRLIRPESPLIPSPKMIKIKAYPVKHNIMPPQKSYEIEEMKKMEADLLDLGLPKYRVHQRIADKYHLSRTHVRTIVSGQTLLKT